MKRYGWLTLGLALALGAGRPATSAEAAEPPKFGVGPAYEALGKLAVMHAGRVKPIDTLAREEVKQVFGRETIKLLDDKNEVAATWGPVGALYDWAVRPGFWDDQPFILVEYLPLKRLLLADAVRAELSAIAGRDSTPAADRDALNRLADGSEASIAALNRFFAEAKAPGANLKAVASQALKLNGVREEDLKAIAAVAAKLREEHKWLSPADLEEATVEVDGRRRPFFGRSRESWLGEILERKEEIEKDVLGKRKLPEIEKRALEVGTRLFHYRTLRSREVGPGEPLLVMPHPSNPAYLAFIARAVGKYEETRNFEAMPLLEQDALKMLQSYWQNIPREDRKIPGVDARADAKFTAWLRDGSEWMPLGTLLASGPEALAEAGFSGEKVRALMAAYKALDEAEAAKPGRVEEARTTALVGSARALGNEVAPSRYPPPDAMDRETYFNVFNPFWKAPIAYGFALALLAVSLGVAATPGRPRSAAGWLGRGLYLAGMAGLLAGIGLEVVGFALRVRISGWAPVTNMYETVIWVSLVSAVLGLVFELIFRRTFAALAASGVALLGTVLAANVPLLDPGIRQLQPVLRSNYWLTIHVLTEVSSYAAFALAMGLGLIATMYYLTATYRRSPRFFELAAPMIPGLPMLAAGAFGLAVSYGAFGLLLTPERATTLFYAAATLAAVGGSLSIVGAGGVLGEAVSRLTFRDEEALDEAAIAGEGSSRAATSVQTVTVGEATGAGAVATLARPSVAEIRAMAARQRPKLDARGLAMQETAARIKPLSNFIYRTMQVGVLLIAAGTILGGVWADYSWGRFWGWDPKEVWALITLLIYLIPLHGRFAGWVNTFGLVMASIACFGSVMMAWYGVNFVLGVGLHSYGFVEGGSQGVVGAVVLAVLAFAGAAAWRRWLASRVPEASA